MRSDSLAKLHHQFLLTQRKMRWLRINTPHDIDPHASNLLPILFTQKALSPSAIADYLQMQPSGVSRMLRHLGDLGYISIRVVDSDARYRTVELTPAGRGALAKSIQLDTYLAITGMDPLDDNQRTRVGELFGEVSDAFGAPREASLPHELPFTTEQKRIARVLGMIGSNYLGSKYDINEYQLLFYLYHAPKPVRFKEIALIVPLEASNLSRQLDRYIGENIVRKGLISEDKRGTSFTLTRQGRALFKAEDDRAQQRLATMLRRWNQTEMNELVNLLSRATSRPAVVKAISRFRFKQCRTTSDWFRARAFIIERLVTRRDHHTLNAELLSEGGLCFTAHRAGTVIGVGYVATSGVIDFLEFHGGTEEAQHFHKQLELAAQARLKVNKIPLSPTASERWKDQLKGVGMSGIGVVSSVG